MTSYRPIFRVKTSNRFEPYPSPQRTVLTVQAIQISQDLQDQMYDNSASTPAVEPDCVEPDCVEPDWVKLDAGYQYPPDYLSDPNDLLTRLMGSYIQYHAEKFG